MSCILLDCVLLRYRLGAYPVCGHLVSASVQILGRQISMICQIRKKRDPHFGVQKETLWTVPHLVSLGGMSQKIKVNLGMSMCLSISFFQVSMNRV